MLHGTEGGLALVTCCDVFRDVNVMPLAFTNRLLPDGMLEVCFAYARLGELAAVLLQLSHSPLDQAVRHTLGRGW